MRPCLPLTSLVLAICTLPLRADEVSYRREVSALLSRGGCNSGACHGNQNGKNGFKLSLRGEDPDFDHTALTRDTQARRVNSVDPDASLLLAKVAGRMPHEGGRRFAPESVEYALLRRWIAEGARDDGGPRLRSLRVSPAEKILVEPADSISLRVEAEFTDGSKRDVTRLSCFEVVNAVASVSSSGVVTRQRFGETAVLARYLDRQEAVRLSFVPARAGYVWKDVPEANFIDRHVFAQLKTRRLLPSDLSSDNVFLRRAYLDTLGIPPTAKEARRFIDDTRADRRARLIDELLKRPEFADFWALKWSDLLRNEEKTIDRKGVQLFHRWVRQEIAEGRPLNEFARELIASRGSTYANPAANYYRALRDPQVRAEATAQVFLGVRLQCARCHNHPFDRWKQDDYHSLASFFARVQYRIVENNRRDRLDKHEFDGDQIVWMDREGDVRHPRTNELLAPRLPGASDRMLTPEGDRLRVLADWVAATDNPFFAKAQVNRVWYHLMGRGIVEPNDDFRASNPPSHPALLDALAKDFIDHKFDLRHAVRTIMNSRTYQLSSVPNATNADDETQFSRAQVRSLPAESLLDALTQVTGAPLTFNGYPAGTRAGQLAGVQAVRLRDAVPTEAERFLVVFGKPERLLSCECERSDDTTLGQAFQLITGKLTNEMIAREDNRLGQLVAAGKSDADVLEELYLGALSRHPTPRERDGALALVRKSKDRRAAWEDVLWGLVNAKEFLLRR